MYKIVRKTIKKIRVIENEDVYDVTTEKNHNFFANNMLVHNCGELPLCPYDSCRLLLLNLLTYVKNPYTAKSYFDFEGFYIMELKINHKWSNLYESW